MNDVVSAQFLHITNDDYLVQWLCDFLLKIDIFQCSRDADVDDEVLPPLSKIDA